MVAEIKNEQNEQFRQEEELVLNPTEILDLFNRHRIDIMKELGKRWKELPEKDEDRYTEYMEKAAELKKTNVEDSEEDSEEEKKPKAEKKQVKKKQAKKKPVKKTVIEEDDEEEE